MLADETSVTEMAGQIAWIGAALRASPGEGEVAFCLPRISIAPKLSYLGKKHLSLSRTAKGLPIYFDIDFSFVSMSVIEVEKEQSLCWLKLFRNPVLVGGYPTRCLSHAASGLEIPLDVMAALLQSQCVTWYSSIPVIKGFSAMAVPIHINQGILQWHLISNVETDHRVSYNDLKNYSASKTVRGIDVVSLETSRHFLGWCPRVNNVTGQYENILQGSSDELILARQAVIARLILSQEATLPKPVLTSSWRKSRLQVASSSMLV